MTSPTTYRESIIEAIHTLNSKVATGDLKDYDFTDITKTIKSYGINGVAKLEEAPVGTLEDILADLLTPTAAQRIFTAS